MQESLWCWVAAAISTTIYLVLFWQVRLLMESALQLYYLVMAAYGWYHWRYGGQQAESLPIRVWSFAMHARAIIAIVLLSLISGSILAQYTDARLPLIDSFTTWGSILATWMVARKVLENWLYFIVIDAVSIFLYLDRELYLTVLLFAAYVVLAGLGYRTWRQHFLSQLR